MVRVPGEGKGEEQVSARDIKSSGWTWLAKEFRFASERYTAYILICPKGGGFGFGVCVYMGTVDGQ